MAGLIYTETEKGVFKKNAFEVASYGAALAEQLGTDCVAVAINPSDASQLQSYGVAKILAIKEANHLVDVFNALYLKEIESYTNSSENENGAELTDPKEDELNSKINAVIDQFKK